MGPGKDQMRSWMFSHITNIYLLVTGGLLLRLGQASEKQYANNRKGKVTIFSKIKDVSV